MQKGSLVALHQVSLNTDSPEFCVLITEASGGKVKLRGGGGEGVLVLDLKRYSIML